MNDLILQNRQTAKFLYKGAFHPIYELENGIKVCCVNNNGTYLHTITEDYEEPIAPLKEEYQPVGEVNE